MVGSAEEAYPDWGYKRQRCYYDDCEESEEDEEDEEEGGCGGHSMEEVLEQTHNAVHWTTLDGKAMEFGEMKVIEEDEVLPPGYFEGQDPDEEEYEGYTGNAGATLDRWYRRAALVIWPRSRRFSILAGTSIAGAICQLAASLAAREPHATCAAFAAAILDKLQQQKPGVGYDPAFYGSIGADHYASPKDAQANSLAQLMGCIAELATGTGGGSGHSRFSGGGAECCRRRSRGASGAQCCGLGVSLPVGRAPRAAAGCPACRPHDPPVQAAGLGGHAAGVAGAAASLLQPATQARRGSCAAAQPVQACCQGGSGPGRGACSCGAGLCGGPVPAGGNDSVRPV